MIKLEKAELNVPANLVYITQYGSHLYGLNTENSDVDYRGIFIPYKEDVLLKRDVDEYNDKEITDSDTDVKLFSIYKFLKLCSKGDTNALDLLFSYSSTHVEKYNLTYENKSVMGFIYENRDKLINTNNMYSYTGYAISQAVKYSLKGNRLRVLNDLIEELEIAPSDLLIKDLIPEIQPLFDDKYLYLTELDNHGTKDTYLFVCGATHQLNLSVKTVLDRIITVRNNYSKRTIASLDGNDWKALSHALRVLYQLEELYDTGNIVYPLRSKDLLLDIKLGKISRETVNDEITRMLEIVQNLGDPLGWRYNQEFWDSKLLEWINNQ